MDNVEYQLRVVFWGGPDEDESLHDGYEVPGPFRRPGDLWGWANAQCYVNAHPAWRDDINALIQKQSRHGWDTIKMALDDRAMRDLEEYESPYADRARVLQGDAAWCVWQTEWRGQDEVESTLPDSWRAIGPVSSCGCEDWPCCVHADDYAFVPSQASTHVALKSCGEFSMEDGVLVAPRAYMEEQGNALVDKILTGEDMVFNMTSGQSADVETAILVRLQTDYAGWIGFKEAEGWLGHEERR